MDGLVGGWFRYFVWSKLLVHKTLTILVLHKLELKIYIVCTNEHEFVGVDVNKRTQVC